MNRSALLLVIAVVLAAYGIYVTSLALPMLAATPLPVLLLCAYVLQAVLAFVGAYQVWRDASSAGAIVVLLGLTIAVTWLIEAFVLGFVAYLPALAVAAVAVILALVIAVYLRGRAAMPAR